MSMTYREPLAAGAGDAGDRPQPSVEILGVRRVVGTIACIAVCRRLLRVLVVDDLRDAADSLSTLVELWGHVVRQAYDGAAALEIASAYLPDVVLLDLAMPKMDGCQLARLLRQQACFTHTLLIAITGYADETHRRLCEAAGFDQRLVKPVAPVLVERLLQLEKDRLAESSGAGG
jgi:CheY-like chemotaxis protein